MGSRDNHAFSMYSGLPTCFTLLFLIVHCFEFSEDFDEAILYQRKNLIRWSRIWYIFVYNLPFYTLLIFDKWQLFFFLYSSANQGRRCPKLTGVGASTVFTRYCWEYFNLPIEPIPLQLDCKASELHCFPHLGTDQRPPQSNLEVLVKLCTNFSPVQLYDVGNYRLGCTLTGWE